MKEIELFKSLCFNININFQKHMINMQQKTTYCIIKNYLEFVGNTDINIKDFLSLITINIYNNEFSIKDEEKIKIKNYIDKYDYINNNKELKVKEYYKAHVEKDNESILKTLKTILKRTSDDVLNHYTKLYYFYNKLSLEIKNEEIM